MTSPTDTPSLPARLRTAWTTAHTPVAGVPRWARTAALAIPLTVLPTCLWRIASVTLHLPIARGDQGSGDIPAWLPMELYALVLSILSELLAFTAVGLIARWGEVFPRWIPGLRGRRIPISAAVIPAALGAAILTVMWTTAALANPFGDDIHGGDGPLDYHHWKGVLAITVYAPLLLWGPLLAAVTVAYYRRRTAGGR
ncbi:hypothetical protein ACFQLX_22960 [Streptomyces polyrhachis]|uniref:Integral membrane protein n=1 Tax=Streptomyces polyrhachis TaxID=1282885 RepID=A0ABW2GJT1_9ACTN